MKIQELRLKHFGKFTDKDIRLREGINILYGENESGKSTLHSFIKGMLFGMERGRGRASAHDAFSTYEPWENPNYYSGTLKFESGGKIFRIDRNFDRYTKKAELTCEDDGELLSVADGDLEMLLGGLDSGIYENTISVAQTKVETGKPLAAEFKNYATNYDAVTEGNREGIVSEGVRLPQRMSYEYTAGSGEVDFGRALEHLKEKKKALEREMKESLLKKQAERERMEQEASYVWRDVHRLEEEFGRISKELEYRQEKAANEVENVESRRIIDELRPAKWRIHPVELILFAIIVILAFILIARPWNFLVSIIIFLACGLYVWNRMKVSKQEEKTPPELILEEITPEEEKIPLEKLVWEQTHVREELREKQIQYGNLKEQLEELDEVSEDYREYDRRRAALQLAMDRLSELSGELQRQVEERLKSEASRILAYITDGKYTQLHIEEGMHLSLFKEGKRISLGQLSRGTVEQVYFALRMAANTVLHEEEYPVILDDTFAYYDDIRLKKVLKWLAEHKKQVIIFTCQNRETKLLDELGITYHIEELPAPDGAGGLSSEKI